MVDWRISLADFLGGLNDRLSSELLRDNEAQIAQNVDLRNGQLAALNDVGSAVATAGSATVNSIWYAAGSIWIEPTTDKIGARQLTGEAGSAVEKRWYCNDGYRTYFTRVGKLPHVAIPSYQHPLGLVPITGFGWALSAGQLTGSVQYAFTYVTDTGLESNPMGFEWIRNLSSQQVSFSSIPTSPDPRVVKRRVWRTQANGTTLYLRAVLDDNMTSTWTDGATVGDSNDAVLDLSTPLTWRSGGWAGSGSDYVEDHSVPPPLTVLSNTLHSVNDAVGISGSGILFGGIGAVAYWSMLGYPDYWPIVNTFTLPESIEAIISHAGVTFYFLASGIYQVSGSSDSDLSWSRTNARFGVMPGEGRTVKQTSFGGIIFKAREGIAFFDGSTARLIATTKISASALRALTINDAAFFDSKYYLFHSTGTVILDFADGLDDVRVTTTTHVVRCVAVASTTDPVTATMLHSGLGSVSQLLVVESGSGYTSVPAVTVGAPISGTTALGTVYVNVDRVVMTNGGTGYTASPDVVFSAPAAGGRPAKGVATISGGSVASIEVIDSGSGYTGSVPTISLTGGGGSNVTTSVLVKAEKVVLTNGGTGYSSTKQPSVTFTAAPSGERTVQGMAVVTAQGYRWLGLVCDGASVGPRLWRIGGLYIDVLVSGQGDTVALSVDEYRESAYETAGAGGSWASRQNLNAVRYRITPVSIGTTVYVYGGRDAAGAAINTMERGTGAGNWTNLGAQTPGALYGYGATTDGVDLYLYGGYDGSSNPQAKLWKYTVATTTWTELTIATPAPANSQRGDCALVYADGSLYVIAGQQSTTTTSSQSTVLIYNLATPAWTTDTNGPAAGFAARVGTAAGGGGAAATAVLTATTVASVTVLTGGSGYTSAPTVTFSGGGGTGATGTAVLTAGAVSSVTITAAGSGYTDVPTVTFTDGGGNGATGIAVLTATSVASVTTTSGWPYGSVPSVVISGGGGTGATGTATVSGGMLTGVTVSAGGSGFTSRPAVWIAPNKIYIYGGRTNNSSLGTAMSDLWEFDPAQSGTTRWHGVGSVVGVPPLARTGYAMAGSKLYLMGGTTPNNMATADLYVIDVQQIADWNLTTGLYVVQNSDSGSIRRFEGGSAMATWIWKSKDFTAPQSAYLSWSRMRIEASGSVTVGISKDGGAVNAVKTLSSVSRATPQVFRLTSGGNARGQRLAIQLTGTTTATVHRVSIEGYHDGQKAGT